MWGLVFLVREAAGGSNKEARSVMLFLILARRAWLRGANEKVRETEVG